MNRALRAWTVAWGVLLSGTALAQAPAQWKYAYADQQYGRYKATFTVSFAVGGESFSLDGGAAVASGADPRSGTYLVRQLGASKTLLEYLPYALAEGAPPASWPAPSGYPTYATPYLEWTYTVKAAGWENVTVPAGTFRALKVEVEGTRGKDPDPNWWPKQAMRFAHTIWYAPEARRYVKARHRAWSMTDSAFADDAVELLELKKE
jgi:hypothetical protein